MVKFQLKLPYFLANWLKKDNYFYFLKSNTSPVKKNSKENIDDKIKCLRLFYEDLFFK